MNFKLMFNTKKKIHFSAKKQKILKVAVVIAYFHDSFSVLFSLHLKSPLWPFLFYLSSSLRLPDERQSDSTSSSFMFHVEKSEPLKDTEPCVMARTESGPTSQKYLVARSNSEAVRQPSGRSRWVSPVQSNKDTADKVQTRRGRTRGTKRERKKRLNYIVFDIQLLYICNVYIYSRMILIYQSNIFLSRNCQWFFFS